MKRIIIIALVLLTILTAILISGCTEENKTISQEPIKIAINVWPGYAHAFVAQEKGFFEKNGVEVELILKEEYSEAQELYTDGNTDGIFEVYVDTIFHNSEGISSKVVYVTDYSDTGDVIIGKPEYNSLADLKGKKIGIEGVNTFSHIFALSAAEKEGLVESEIQFESVFAGDVLTALEEGKIDAGHTWEPTTSEALEKGYKILGKAGDVPGIITDVLTFNSKIIKERPKEVEAIVKSLLEARNFVYTDREEALEIMSAAENIPKGEMNEGIEGVVHPNLKENMAAMKDTEETTSLYSSGRIISNFYISRGQLSSIPDFDKIIESKFIENIE